MPPDDHRAFELFARVGADFRLANNISPLTLGPCVLNSSSHQAVKMLFLSKTHPVGESDLQVKLHPLVLLSVSDYITRHAVRQLNGPIVGAIIGQQSGRTITLEHAFDAKTVPDQGTRTTIIDFAWFADRLQQYRDVHQQPALELVGWFTTAPTTGPTEEHYNIHALLTKDYNENAVLLCLHPKAIGANDDVADKLPVSIYESSLAPLSETDRQELDKVVPDYEWGLRFLEVPYMIDAGEAEMIGVDAVVNEGRPAIAVDTALKRASQAETEDGAKGKEKAEAKDSSSALAPEDEDQIASLNAKKAAVHQMQRRIRLMKDYLAILPPSYTIDTTIGLDSPPPTATNTLTLPNGEIIPFPTINHPLLRSVYSLLARLPLLDSPTIAQRAALEAEMNQQETDVTVVSLLGLLGQSVLESRELGKKFSTVEKGRWSAATKNRGSDGRGALFNNPTGAEGSSTTSAFADADGSLGRASGGPKFDINDRPGLDGNKDIEDPDAVLEDQERAIQHQLIVDDEGYPHDDPEGEDDDQDHHMGGVGLGGYGP